jgi:hypothetical protein
MPAAHRIWRGAEYQLMRRLISLPHRAAAGFSLTLKIAKQLLTLPAVLAPGAMTIKEVSERFRFDAQSLHKYNSIRFKIMRAPIETKGGQPRIVDA